MARRVGKKQRYAIWSLFNPLYGISESLFIVAPLVLSGLVMIRLRSPNRPC